MEAEIVTCEAAIAKLQQRIAHIKKAQERLSILDRRHNTKKKGAHGPQPDLKPIGTN